MTNHTTPQTPKTKPLSQFTKELIEEGLLTQEGLDEARAKVKDMIAKGQIVYEPVVFCPHCDRDVPLGGSK